MATGSMAPVAKHADYSVFSMRVGSLGHICHCVARSAEDAVRLSAGGDDDDDEVVPVGRDHSVHPSECPSANGELETGCWCGHCDGAGYSPALDRSGPAFPIGA